MSWFRDADGETFVWALIAAAIIVGTCYGLWYWDRFLNQVHENERFAEWRFWLK
ncbi:hypothetical protein [Alicyclobacillus suci]|uniref:hypothetical protein n=1 Tax=Alicyclobacillus suci TaxID=2816080 RepID=UPI001A8F6E86|nr:hypothetical protein [Alicyclobacillus suci]